MFFLFFSFPGNANTSSISRIIWAIIWDYFSTEQNVQDDGARVVQPDGPKYLIIADVTLLG